LLSAVKVLSHPRGRTKGDRDSAEFYPVAVESGDTHLAEKANLDDLAQGSAGDADRGGNFVILGF